MNNSLSAVLVPTGWAVGLARWLALRRTTASIRPYDLVPPPRWPWGRRARRCGARSIR